MEGTSHNFIDLNLTVENGKVYAPENWAIQSSIKNMTSFDFFFRNHENYGLIDYLNGSTCKGIVN